MVQLGEKMILDDKMFICHVRGTNVSPICRALGSFIHSFFVRSFVHSFVRSFVHSFVRLFNISISSLYIKFVTSSNVWLFLTHFLLFMPQFHLVVNAEFLAWFYFDLMINSLPWWFWRIYRLVVSRAHLHEGTKEDLLIVRPRGPFYRLRTMVFWRAQVTFYNNNKSYKEVAYESGLRILCIRIREERVQDNLHAHARYPGLSLHAPGFNPYIARAEERVQGLDKDMPYKNKVRTPIYITDMPDRNKDIIPLLVPGIVAGFSLVSHTTGKRNFQTGKEIKFHKVVLPKRSCFISQCLKGIYLLSLT